MFVFKRKYNEAIAELKTAKKDYKDLKELLSNEKDKHFKSNSENQAKINSGEKHVKELRSTINFLTEERKKDAIEITKLKQSIETKEVETESDSADNSLKAVKNFAKKLIEIINDKKVRAKIPTILDFCEDIQNVKTKQVTTK